MAKKILKIILPWCFYSEKILFWHSLGKLCLKWHLIWLAKGCENKIYKKYHCHISNQSVIGKNVKFDHPVGIVIGTGVKIGENCVIYQNVTLGRKDRTDASYPIISNDVIIYCNSVIVGNIVVGKGAIIGANSFVNSSIEENTIFINKKGMEK